MDLIITIVHTCRFIAIFSCTKWHYSQVVEYLDTLFLVIQAFVQVDRSTVAQIKHVSFLTSILSAFAFSMATEPF